MLKHCWNKKYLGKKDFMRQEMILVRSTEARPC
jgi:hypothetical protein